MSQGILDSELVLKIVQKILADDPALAGSLIKADLGERKLVELAQDHADELLMSTTAERERLAVAEAQLRQATDRLPKGFRVSEELAARSLSVAEEVEQQRKALGLDALELGAEQARSHYERRVCFH